MPRPRALVLLGALVAVRASLLVVAAVLSVDWRIIDFGPAESLALFFVLQPVFAVVFARRRPLSRTVALVVAGGWALCSSSASPPPGSPSAATRAPSPSPARSRWAKRCCSRSRAASPITITTATPRASAAATATTTIPPSIPAPRRSAATASTKTATASTRRSRRRTPSEKNDARPRRRKFKWNGNLLVITIDTLRADRVNAKTAPHLYKFMQESVSFSHARAQAPNTPRSFPSFLTSRYPSEVRWQKMSR